MRYTDDSKIVQVLKNNNTNLVIESFERPINLDSRIDIQCMCGNLFNLSLRKIHAYNRRRTTISCGCIDKKWTNANIDKKLAGRNIIRLTNCDVKGFSPSVHHVYFKCTLCDHEWSAVFDSIANKQVGCPNCVGNVPYTPNSLNDKLRELGRTDIKVLEIFKGSQRKGKKVSRVGLFECSICSNIWKANIHNILQFSYGCPKCNDNMSTRVEVNGERFHSKLEYYFYQQYLKLSIGYQLVRQYKYLDNRRLTCDYYIPEKKLWIEITGGTMLSFPWYQDRINEKQTIVQNKQETFITLSTTKEINKFLQTIGESND